MGQGRNAMKTPEEIQIRLNRLDAEIDRLSMRGMASMALDLKIRALELLWVLGLGSRNKEDD
jgi:hypothetical protein